MKKILIVDDQPNILELVRMTLELDDHVVHEARSGEEALAKARQIRPDLMLLDIMMPGAFDGLEACRRIKADAALRGIKVVMLTARGQAKDHEAGKAAGADHYLAKPFSPRELLAIVATLT